MISINNQAFYKWMELGVPCCTDIHTLLGSLQTKPPFLYAIKILTAGFECLTLRSATLLCMSCYTTAELITNSLSNSNLKTIDDRITNVKYRMIYLLRAI